MSLDRPMKTALAQCIRTASRPTSSRCRRRSAGRGRANGAPDGGRTRAQCHRFWALASVCACTLLLLGVLAGCAGVRSPNDASATGHPPGSDEVRLVVSRGFGASVTHDETVPWHPGLTVMALLSEQAAVTTQYGGGFVSGIDGLKSTFGGVSAAKAADWFYWVDGVMASVGAADYRLHGGQTVWWDYHRWAHAMFVPATLSAFPVPWKGHAMALASDQSWPGLSDWVKAAGLTIAQTSPLSTPASSGALVVATPRQAADTPWLARLLAAGDGGLHLVQLQSGRVSLLSPTGAKGPTVEAVVMALPHQSGDGRLYLVILAASPAAAEQLLAQLRPSACIARVGVALVGGKLVSLPWSAQ